MGVSLSCGSGITEGLLVIIHVAISPPISLSLKKETKQKISLLDKVEQKSASDNGRYHRRQACCNAAC